MATDLTLQNAIEKFVSHLESLDRSSNTIVAYQGDLSQFADYLADQGITEINQVETNNIKEFKEHLKENRDYTAKTVSRKLNSVKSFFRFLVEEGVVEKDYSRPVKHPKIENDLPRVLKPMEYRALRDVCRHDKRTLAIIELMLQAGLRISEVANLRMDDIGEDTITIRAYESHERREIPLNRAAKESIEDYLEERYPSKKDYLFVTKTGRQLLVRNIRSIINRYFEKAGLEDVKVNDLRNTFIVEQLSAGVPLDVVAKIVGHKRISTTERYLKLVEEPEEEDIDLKEL
jgi:site-specific recombinase XerD